MLAQPAFRDRVSVVRQPQLRRPSRSKIALSARLWGEREGPRRGVGRKPEGLTRGDGEGEVGDTGEPQLPPAHPDPLCPRGRRGRGGPAAI
jgi:hypothetical protein